MYLQFNAMMYGNVNSGILDISLYIAQSTYTLVDNGNKSTEEKQ